MNIFDTAKVISWSVAKKTKGLRAKPMVSILTDRSVMNSFMVDTLEAREPVSADSMFCIGEANDAWQQTPTKLLQKYNVVSIDKDGWMICEPKPENSVECFELTMDAINSVDPEFLKSSDDMGIIGQWGEIIDGIKNVQRFVIGDYICRNRVDKSDQWIVRKKLFRNTYTELT